MKTADFDYRLPQELIAQQSIEPRDMSRLMIVDKTKHAIEHKQFRDILEYLLPGDLLVWNTSRVFKARLFGQLLSVEGQVLRNHSKLTQVFLVRPMENPGVWQVLARPGKHVTHNTRIQFADDFFCDVIMKKKDGTILVQFEDSEEMVRAKANQYGHIPVPPYVTQEPAHIEQYQTSYADPSQEGSVAAPTAGFHFTPSLIKEIKKRGIDIATIALHVGLGTFLPVKTEDLSEHVMHNEWVELAKENADKITRAKQEGRRVIAIGTTTVRTLEGIAQFAQTDYRPQITDDRDTYTSSEHSVDRRQLSVVRPYKGDINLFITPGFEFRVVDALITNFHLPKSTLLMLVSAFVGDTEFMLDCYKKAVEDRYRFFSFGDAMFIQ